MGSFYTTCSISKMTLSRQKTSIQLLVPGYSTDYDGHKSMVVSNNGSQCFYSPFGFPIHGIYDDCGHICGIIRDDNVKMLETYFGVSIGEIIESVSSDEIPDNVKNVETFKTLGMTYFRTEVLEYVQGGWESINLETPEKYSGDERVANIIKQIELSRSMYNHTYIASLAKKDMFAELPITIDFKEEILKQYQFLMNLGYKLNTNLLPSNYGSQDTNWVEQYKLNEFVNDILVEDMKKDVEDSNIYDYNLRDEEDIIKSHSITKRYKKINTVLD